MDKEGVGCPFTAKRKGQKVECNGEDRFKLEFELQVANYTKKYNFALTNSQIQVNNYEIVVKFFHISHNLT